MWWMCENVVRFGVVEVHKCRNTMSYAKAAALIVMILAL